MSEPFRASIDLHTHTCYSDGRAAPAELLAQAAALGIHTLAITDHDNARAVRVARPLAAALGLELIPALELTCRWDASGAPPWESDIDVLGYFVDVDSQPFLRLEQHALADLRTRTQARCDLLSRAGYPVTMADVLAQNPRYPGSLSMADALVTLGLAATFRESMRLIDLHRDQVPVCSLTIDRAIAAIRALGGVAVLAHPSLVRWRGGWLDERAVGQLVEMGLAGLEIYHYRMNTSARAHFLRLKRQYGLLASGGSDEHGWPEGFPRLGAQPVTAHMLEAIALRANHRSPSGAPPR